MSRHFVFSNISDFIVRCAHRHGIERIVNYLDDFCLIINTKKDAVYEQLTIISILRRLGFSSVIKMTVRMR